MYKRGSKVKEQTLATRANGVRLAGRPSEFSME